MRSARRRSSRWKSARSASATAASAPSAASITKPGIVTAVVGQCDMTLDQRHLNAESLATMLQEAKDASERFADEEKVGMEWSKLWEIHPIPFDPELIELADEAIRRDLRHIAPPAERSAPRRRRSRARGRADGHAVRPKPARAFARQSRRHQRGTHRPVGRSARPPRHQNDALDCRAQSTPADRARFTRLPPPCR